MLTNAQASYRGLLGLGVYSQRAVMEGSKDEQVQSSSLFLVGIEPEQLAKPNWKKLLKMPRALQEKKRKKKRQNWTTGDLGLPAQHFGGDAKKQVVRGNKYKTTNLAKTPCVMAPGWPTCWNTPHGCLGV